MHLRIIDSQKVSPFACDSCLQYGLTRFPKVFRRGATPTLTYNHQRQDALDDMLHESHEARMEAIKAAKQQKQGGRGGQPAGAVDDLWGDSADGEV